MVEEENKQVQKVADSGEELNIIAASKKLAVMWDFIKNNLEKGNDYMSIQGGKPALLKSGAEKMNILVGYASEYEKTKEIVTPKENFYYVEVKCVLRDKQGRKVADCIASCNNQEKSKRHLEFADSLNSVLKIAEKRAYVGATLNANALSQFYTPDLADDDNEPKTDSKGAVLCCALCGEEISQKVAEYSAEKFGKLICIKCQKSPLK